MNLGELRDQLRAIVARAQDLRRPLEALGPVLVSSCVRNFQLGGRPDAWTPVRPATAKRKAKAGHSKVLIWSGRLYRSITFQVVNNVLKVGSNLPYARIHQLGGVIEQHRNERTLRFRLTQSGELMTQADRGKGKGRNLGNLVVFAAAHHKRVVEKRVGASSWSSVMPARPYLVIQPEDRAQGNAVIVRWILEGKI